MCASNSGLSDCGSGRVLMLDLVFGGTRISFFSFRISAPSTTIFDADPISSTGLHICGDVVLVLDRNATLQNLFIQLLPYRYNCNVVQTI